MYRPSIVHQRKGAQSGLYQNVTFQHYGFQFRIQKVQQDLCFWILQLPSEMHKRDIYEQKENNATNNELQKIRDNFFGAWINENCGC